MEDTNNLGMKKEVIPSLIRSIDANDIEGFDDSLMKNNVLYEVMVCYSLRCEFIYYMLLKILLTYVV